MPSFDARFFLHYDAGVRCIIRKLFSNQKNENENIFKILSDF